MPVISTVNEAFIGSNCMCERPLTFRGVDFIAVLITAAKCAVCVLVNVAGNKGGKETQFFLTVITLHSTVRRYCSYFPF